jgi:hypothetical protein
MIFTSSFIVDLLCKMTLVEPISFQKHVTKIYDLLESRLMLYQNL